MYKQRLPIKEYFWDYKIKLYKIIQFIIILTKIFFFNCKVFIESVYTSILSYLSCPKITTSEELYEIIILFTLKKSL